ncbi:MAG: helix-turn-helix domain-containing protein [Verrucomicrobiales bacterium]|nr:helix-turn-helix domain-containing protein [Verrucomicrobiales bacterium]
MEVLAETLYWRPVVVGRVSAVPAVFRVGPSLIHRHTGRVESPHGERWLRRMELELLVHLYEHIPQTFAREQLLQEVWRCRPGLVTRTVDQTVATLRRKLNDDSAKPKYLVTVHGVGYRLRQGPAD